MATTEQTYRAGVICVDVGLRTECNGNVCFNRLLLELECQEIDLPTNLERETVESWLTA
jgi:hypothetical protein